MNYARTLLRAAAVCALIAACALPALAETMGTVKYPGADLHVTASMSAAAVDTGQSGDRVEFVARDGLFWRKVRLRGKEGWMLRTAITWDDDAPATPQATVIAAPATPAAPAPPVAAATPSPSGPASPFQPATVPRFTNPFAGMFGQPASGAAPDAVGAAAVPQAPAQPATPAPPRGHAVVFGISQYNRPNTSDLPGVPHDMDSAKAMAMLMGVTEDRVAIYREAEVTRDGIVATLTQLAREVADGEPVLVYFSGHGSRFESPAGSGRCLEGLLTADGQVFTAEQMSALIQPLARKTDGLFVFFDACHTGNLTASRATGPQQLKAKFAPRAGPAGAVSNCLEIVNMLQPQQGGGRATGNRYIYAAAARADEAAADDGEKGGLATTNFLNCMVAGNGQTVDAIRACAQQGIDQRLKDNPTFKPHHITISGDVNIRPVRADLSPAFKQSLLAEAANGTLTNRVARAKSAQVNLMMSAQGWPRVDNPGQAFKAIVDMAEPGSVLAVDAPQTLKINAQTLQMKVRAPADGYLYVFQSSGNGSNAYLLFPNVSDRDNRVSAGQVVDLPRASWPLMAGGPEGDDQLLVVFSRAERDIGQLVGQSAGPFLDLAVSPIGMQALTLAVSRSAYADEAECKAQVPASRPAACSPGFSATLKIIREIP